MPVSRKNRLRDFFEDRVKICVTKADFIILWSLFSFRPSFLRISYRSVGFKLVKKSYNCFSRWWLCSKFHFPMYLNFFNVLFLPTALQNRPVLLKKKYNRSLAMFVTELITEITTTKYINDKQMFQLSADLNLPFLSMFVSQQQPFKLVYTFLLRHSVYMYTHLGIRLGLYSLFSII